MHRINACPLQCLYQSVARSVASSEARYAAGRQCRPSAEVPLARKRPASAASLPPLFHLAAPTWKASRRSPRTNLDGDQEDEDDAHVLWRIGIRSRFRRWSGIVDLSSFYDLLPVLAFPGAHIAKKIVYRFAVSIRGCAGPSKISNPGTNPLRPSNTSPGKLCNRSGLVYSISPTRFTKYDPPLILIHVIHLSATLVLLQQMSTYPRLWAREGCRPAPEMKAVNPIRFPYGTLRQMSVEV